MRNMHLNSYSLSSALNALTLSSKSTNIDWKSNLWISFNQMLTDLWNECHRIPNLAGLANWTTREFLSCCLSPLHPSQMAWTVLQNTEREAEYYLRMLSFRTERQIPYISQKGNVCLLVPHRTVKIKLFQL